MIGNFGEIRDLEDAGRLSRTLAPVITVPSYPIGLRYMPSVSSKTKNLTVSFKPSKVAKRVRKLPHHATMFLTEQPKKIAALLGRPLALQKHIKNNNLHQLTTDSAIMTPPNQLSEPQRSVLRNINENRDRALANLKSGPNFNKYQYLFPTRTDSEYVFKNASLGDDDALIQYLIDHQNFQNKLKEPLKLILKRFGFEVDENGTVYKSDNKNFSKNLDRKNSCSHKRVTRVLECLSLFKKDDPFLIQVHHTFYKELAKLKKPSDHARECWLFRSPSNDSYTTQPQIAASSCSNNGQPIELNEEEKQMYQRITERWNKALNKLRENPEGAHDYVQVLFPNRLMSRVANQDIFLNGDNLINYLIECKYFQDSLQEPLELMLKHFGFEVDSDGIVIPSNDGNLKRYVDTAVFDHNQMRVTRVLKCLYLFKRGHPYLTNVYNTFYSQLCLLENPSEEVKEYWTGHIDR